MGTVCPNKAPTTIPLSEPTINSPTIRLTYNKIYQVTEAEAKKHNTNDVCARVYPDTANAHSYICRNKNDLYIHDGTSDNPDPRNLLNKYLREKMCMWTGELRIENLDKINNDIENGDGTELKDWQKNMLCECIGQTEYIHPKPEMHLLYANEYGFIFSKSKVTQHECHWADIVAAIYALSRQDATKCADNYTSQTREYIIRSSENRCAHVCIDPSTIRVENNQIYKLTVEEADVLNSRHGEILHTFKNRSYICCHWPKLYIRDRYPNRNPRETLNTYLKEMHVWSAEYNRNDNTTTIPEGDGAELHAWQVDGLCKCIGKTPGNYMITDTSKNPQCVWTFCHSNAYGFIFSHTPTTNNNTEQPTEPQYNVYAHSRQYAQKCVQMRISLNSQAGTKNNTPTIQRCESRIGPSPCIYKPHGK